MNRYKSEEGAVLLLLIIMMSAVVLIVASLLRFNTQNIRFAAIEVQQEQALYLAEGVADHLDSYLIDYLFEHEVTEANIRTCLNDYKSAASSQTLLGIHFDESTPEQPFFVLPTNNDFLDKTTIDEITVQMYDSRGESESFLVEEDKDPYGILLYYKVKVIISISTEDTSRTILATYHIPPDLVSSIETPELLFSKELNYSS